jgi:copper chaperone CopZ
MTLDNKMTTTLTIDGMKCQNCAGRVEKAVSLLAGVDKVTVDLAAKTATLTYDKAQTDISSIKAAINILGHGYKVINNKSE